MTEPVTTDPLIAPLVEASGLVMLGVCSVKGPSCTAPVTAAPITVVVEVETKNQIPVCRACFKERVADGNWHPSWTGKAMVAHQEATTPTRCEATKEKP
jgi:hypothetical protein